MPTYGYARVSTIDQDLSLQRRTLKAAGCDVIRGYAIERAWIHPKLDEAGTSPEASCPTLISLGSTRCKPIDLAEANPVAHGL
jgi:hypothetical protein